MDIFSFFTTNFPPLSLIARLFPISILWSFAALTFAGYCKKKFHFKTGYTRKIFHFLIFISAAFFQIFYSLQGVFILGWSVTVVLIFACYKGNGFMLYEAIAREKDAPYRTKYIVYSYLATFLGGVFSNILFGQYAIFGYAITGVADAIAEPIGTRFGKHQYRVFSFDKMKVSYRSIEGSLSVLVATLLVIVLLATTFFSVSIPFYYICAIAIFCMLVEAVSPSGFDNLLLQLCSSYACYFIIQLL